MHYPILEVRGVTQRWMLITEGEPHADTCALVYSSNFLSDRKKLI